ncbi:MAG TPA: glycosyltransferase [Tepidisphaeraceae bacterium]|nr:glycosyltransferase [Tepidisphaeraceae bacterium]
MPADTSPANSATTGASAQSESPATSPAAISLYPQPLPHSTDELSSQPEPVLLFEVAWEVCWQLGGIYTVLRTKAAAMLDRWGDRYCLIGPYNPHTAAVEFEELPTEGVIRDTLDRLRAAGVPCHYGRWLISGRPRVILLDYRARSSSLDVDKYLLWKDHGIETLGCDAEVNDVVAFGYVVADFFRELSDLLRGRRAILAHFHEWMGGVAVPRIAHMQLPVATVFTTHATLLGRYLASDNPYFYQHLPFIQADQEAVKYNILSKHQIEKTAAHACTVFTTVSEVTAFEAEKLLGRKPDAILPNGLNIQRFAALHEFQNLHRQFKEKIHEFVMGHFFPAYAFDLEHTLYVFTSGRYEYRNKGLDMFIESMYRLNQALRGVPDRPTIVAFIITRAATRNINVGALQNQAMFDELRATCGEIEREMGRRLFLAATTGRLPGMNELLADDAVVRLKRAMHVWRSGRQPSIVTHDLVDDANDAVLRHLRWRQLFNAADDPVKVVFHPEFLTATSPLISLDYNDFVRGCHLGIFPSYYEPWGYTPMESIARGVPAVTTDLSGFGAYVQRHIEDARSQGIMVLNRRNRSFEDAVNDLVQYLLEFIQLNRRQRIELRNRTERLGELFDWSVLVSHYHEAHDLALERRGGLRPGTFELRIV